MVPIAIINMIYKKRADAGTRTRFGRTTIAQHANH
jgi:hypothetical protein